MDTKSADLSALRIDRSAQPTPSAGGSRRWLLLGVTVLGIAAGAAGVLLASGRAIGGGLEVHLVPATMVSPSQAASVLVASGYVVAQRKAAVASKGTGRLVYLGVVEGDHVTKGQVIARIEDNDVRAQLAQAQAQLKSNQADLQNAELTVQRLQSIVQQGLGTPAALDSAKSHYEQVKANIMVAEAAVQGAQVALENTVIRAPFEGTVLTKDADVGEVVAPFAASAFSKGAVVTIADMHSLQMEADVAEDNLSQVSVGQPCEIVLDAYPDIRYAAHVTKIVPTADRAKATVQVKVAFDKYDAKVLPEMSAKAHFLPPARAKADTARVLVVPEHAVADRSGRAVAFTVSGDRAVEVPVTLGPRLGASVVITQGLAAGTMVVDSVSDKLRAGVTVQAH